MNTEIKNIKQTQVSEAMSYLLNCIELTDNKLTDLENRLEQVRWLRLNEIGKLAETEKEKCKLAKTISDYGDRVNLLSDRIGEILATLEI